MRYFVTGATGFIGKRLVRELLARGAGTIHVLARFENRDKLAALLESCGAHAHKIVPVFGDLRREVCGVSDADIDALAGKIDHFFHLAAIYDLAAPANAVATANIDGTRNAVHLAIRLRARLFHHVSSIAAVGLYEGVFREDMFDEATGLDHPYFQSKHEAERIVRQECSIPWRVYRPGMVVGDSRTGEAEKVDGPYYFFKLIQRSRELLPSWLPSIGIEGGRINIVPVDYVVQAMCHIAHLPGLDGKCFHLTDPQPMRVGEVLNVFAHAAHAPAMTMLINGALLGLLPDFIRKGILALKPVRRLTNAIMEDLGLPPGIMQFVNYPTRFDNRQAAAALEGSGIVCPRLDTYADRLWDYWERHLDPDLHVDRSLAGKVRGKRVLVTGGSSGIGLAAANRLAEAGARTIICGRDQERLDAFRSQAEAAGRDVHVYAVDLADLEDCECFVRRLIADHGGIDILVNNAGRSIRRTVDASFDRFHDFQRTMQLNYFGALRVTMGLLPGMIERGEGQVINISSIGVLAGAPRFSAYIASKAALDAWTECAAAELADTGVHFTTVNMPLVRTPMIAPTHAYRNVPALTPEEAAELVVHAIVQKPVRIATRVGLAGRGMHTFTPKAARLTLNTMYRLFPDAEETAAGIAPQASPEQLAMQHLLRGMHF
jgi:NAD(P)-dependent dehydrogenase (short-subunit alcohol dehydrogenase family)